MMDKEFAITNKTESVDYKKLYGKIEDLEIRIHILKNELEFKDDLIKRYSNVSKAFRENREQC